MLAIGLPVGLLVVCSVGLAVALRLGPVEVDFLKGTFQSAIDRQIAPLHADVGAATVQYDSDAGGLALRLTSVDLTGADGKPAASIATAIVNLGWTSLLTGSFDAKALTLEEPQFLLRYDTGRGLALATKAAAPGTRSVAPPGSSSEPSQAPEAFPSPPTAATPQSNSDRDIVGAIRAILAGAKSAGSASTATLHIRSGRLNIEGLGKSTPWRIPEFDLSLDQRDGRGILVGSGQVVGPSGKSHATLSAEQPEGASNLKLTVAVDRMVPADFANLSPAMNPLEAALLPVGGEASLDFGAGGELERLDMNVGLGAGLLDVGGACANSFRLDHGGAHIRYVRGTGRIDLLPSNLRSNGSGATVSGLAQVTKDQNGRDRWQYSLAFDAATIADTSHEIGRAHV